MRSRGFQLYLGLGLLCLVLLFVGGPGPHSSRTFSYGWGMGHLFCFALWTRLYLDWRAKLPLGKQVLEVVLLALILGSMTELLQGAVGREASWLDLSNDMLGSISALFFSPLVSERLSKLQLRAGRTVVCGLVLWSLLPLAQVMLDEVIAWQQFPLLAGFETPLERQRFGGNSRQRITEDQVYSGTAALSVELNTDRYSGVSLRHFPGDWQNYRALKFQLYNPNAEKLKLLFRVHDQQHELNGNHYSDRFNTSFFLQPGWNTLEFPLDKIAAAPRKRRMDLAKIAGIIIFTAKLEAPQIIYLDELQLVR